MEKAREAAKRLRGTMADLARNLQTLVYADAKSPVFKSLGDHYQAAFTTRYLLRDEQRHFRFGDPQ